MKNKKTVLSSPSAVLLTEGRRVLRELQLLVQSGHPDVEAAVFATLSLASIATNNFAMAAHSPASGPLAEKAASRKDYIPVLKGRVPWYAEKIKELKTFHTYRPRPRRKGLSDMERNAMAWLDGSIESFWRGVISPQSLIPPLADQVRTRLLASKNPQNATEWAKEFLAWLDRCELGFLIDHPHSFFQRRKLSRKKPGADPVRAGFIKLASEHFKPLLKHEADQTNITPR